MKARRVEGDVKLDGDLSEDAWQDAEPAAVEYTLAEAEARPALATEVRCLWSEEAIYFGFSCPYSKLTVFDPPAKEERLGLWDRDVVEMFLGTDPAKAGRYAEFEVAPTNERLDVIIDRPEKDFGWASGFESAVRVDEVEKRWTVEVRIPAAALSPAVIAKGARLPLNLYRSDISEGVFLAWSPTLLGTAHAPERFGVLKLE
jgi:hypothetical protein